MLSEKYITLCNKYGFPVFDPACDTALIANWIDGTTGGDDLHALMSNEFSQGFLMGRMLTMMEDQLEFEDGEEESEEA